MQNAVAFAKKHLVSLLFGVLALVAVGVALGFAPSLKADLQAKLEESKKVDDDLRAVEAKAHTLPDFTGLTTPPPLTVFPTGDVIGRGEQALNDYKATSTKLVDDVLKANELPPLVSNVLPDAPNRNAQIEFRERYRAAMGLAEEDGGNGAAATPAGRGAVMRFGPDTLVGSVLKPSLPPTPEEVKAEQDARAAQIAATKTQYNAQGQPLNKPEVDAEIAEATSAVGDELRLARASEHALYISPDAVPPHPAMVDTQTPAPSQPAIFNAQAGLWAIRNVAEALAAANAGATSVLDAPVKHLVELRVPVDVVTGDLAGGGGGGSNYTPNADPSAAPTGEKPTLPADPAADPVPDYQRSPFGHARSPLADPMPIRLTMVVRTDAVPAVLDTLASGRLLVVKNVELRAVEQGRALAAGYLYGPEPVVEVRADLDWLMMRAWSKRYMPDEVVAALIAAANPATPGG